MAKVLRHRIPYINTLLAERYDSFNPVTASTFNTDEEFARLQDAIERGDYGHPLDVTETQLAQIAELEAEVDALPKPADWQDREAAPVTNRAQANKRIRALQAIRFRRLQEAERGTIADKLGLKVNEVVQASSEGRVDFETGEILPDAETPEVETPEVEETVTA